MVKRCFKQTSTPPGGCQLLTSLNMSVVKLKYECVEETPQDDAGSWIRQSRFKEGSSPLSCKKRLPHSSHHHSVAFQGHSCDWRGLMCILPELNLILGALPRASYVRFKPPPSSTSIFFLFFFLLSVKQTERELPRLEKLHARSPYSWEIMCGSVSEWLCCLYSMFCFCLYFPQRL